MCMHVCMYAGTYMCVCAQVHVYGDVCAGACMYEVAYLSVSTDDSVILRS